MDEIRTEAEAVDDALCELTDARAMMRLAMEHLERCENMLYGYRARDSRVIRRLCDALDAVQARIDSLDPRPDDLDDEPVDLASPPVRACRNCGRPADPRGEDIGLCWGCGHSLPEADQADEPVDLASPPEPVRCACKQIAVLFPDGAYWCEGCNRRVEA